ncbi:MAG: histidine kinase [Proteobacteria bacterium]|nr:histidine kinase [Pseudomonadota bacterium]
MSAHGPIATGDPAVPATSLGGFLRWLRGGWPLYVGLWLLFGVYLGINQLIHVREALPALARWKPIVWEVSSVVMILLLIPLVVGLEQRVRVDGKPRRRVLAVHALGAIAFSLVHTTGMVLIRQGVYAALGDRYDFGSPLIGWAYELQKDVITYGLVLGAIFALRELRVRRASELRAQALASDLAAARLSYLTAQIEPHFLFNALNAISNRMHEDVEAADRMLSHLAALLRAAYDADGSPFVPLGRELGWLRDYAAMMSERFRGQLTFRLEVAPGLEGVLVPRLLLQPLVENALKHGLPGGSGTVEVRVECVDGRICYRVRDDGAGLPAAGVRHGTGLGNVGRRLELLFPGRHGFALEAAEPRGAVATVSFPAAP